MPPLITLLGILFLAIVGIFFTIRASPDSPDSSPETAPSSAAEVLLTPPPFTPVDTTHRWVKEKHVMEENGLQRDAVRYYSAQWQPSPWGLLAWTDRTREAEVFAFVRHPDIEFPASITVYWSNDADERFAPRDFKAQSKELRPDEEYEDRFVHRGYDPNDCFLIQIEYLNDRIYIYHRPLRPTALPAPPRVAQEPTPMMKESEPVAPNPFMDTIERISTLHEQYEEARNAVLAKELNPEAEQCALAELERLYQDAIAKLEEEDATSTPL
jgi:hypothetical protein